MVVLPSTASTPLNNYTNIAPSHAYPLNLASTFPLPPPNNLKTSWQTPFISPPAWQTMAPPPPLPMERPAFRLPPLDTSLAPSSWMMQDTIGSSLLQPHPEMSPSESDPNLRPMDAMWLLKEITSRDFHIDCLGDES